MQAPSPSQLSGLSHSELPPSPQLAPTGTLRGSHPPSPSHRSGASQGELPGSPQVAVSGAKFGRHSPLLLQLSGASQALLVVSPHGVPGGFWPALAQRPKPSHRSPSRQAPSPPPQAVSKGSKFASQLPNPSQLSGASQSVESVEPQLVPAPANRSAGQAAESPSQTSAASQRFDASRQVVPASSGVQIPSRPGRSHRAQPWLQATLQQKPSKQPFASPQTVAAVAGVQATGPPIASAVSAVVSGAVSGAVSTAASSLAVSALPVSFTPESPLLVSRTEAVSSSVATPTVSPPAHPVAVNRSSEKMRQAKRIIMGLP
jgi:hypothetical protein